MISYAHTLFSCCAYNRIDSRIDTTIIYLFIFIYLNVFQHTEITTVCDYYIGFTI